MDRLLCGDVGFGKTEVAFRAVYLCILSGKQAALMCPSTVLCSQHFNTAMARFSNFGATVACLNRFNTPKEQERILQGLRDGTIDFVVGTHRLLSADVQFKNLGLLVLDEEQRFGVEHKEKIKNLRKNCRMRFCALSCNNILEKFCGFHRPCDKCGCAAFYRRGDGLCCKPFDEFL